MADTLQIMLLLITGAAGGFLSGLLGVGGGLIFVPVIDYYLSNQGINGNLLVGMILANSLATIVFTGAVGSIKQFRMGNYFPRETALTSTGGIATSLFLSYLISRYPFYSKSMFNLFFACMLLILIVRMLKHKQQDKQTEKTPDSWKSANYMLSGALAGCVTALSGLGGGLVMVPVFNQLLKLNLKTSTSISTGVITFLVLPVAAYYACQPVPHVLRDNTLMIGWLNGKIILPLALGSLFFTPLGVKTAHLMPTQNIRVVFLIFAGVVLIKTIYEIFV